MSSLVLLPLALLGLASGLECTACWGFNHLMFLPPIWWWVYSAVCLTVVTLLFAPLSEKPFERVLTIVDAVLFGPRWWPRLALALIAMVVFWLLRAETHFLGDGYTQLSVFGQSYEFTGRWTAPLAGWIVAQVQGLIGAYTWDTAERAFQIVSIACGGTYVFAILSLSRLMWEDAIGRMLTMTTALCGGGIMLFCGYVEVYAMLWSAATLFLWLSLRVLRNDGSMCWPVLALILTIAIHLQAIYLIPATIGLAIVRYGLPFGTRWAAVTIITLLVGGIVVWMLKWGMTWPDMLMDINDPGHGYLLFSGKHLLDIANQAVLVAPLAPLLLFVALGRGTSRFGVVILPTAVVAAGFLFMIKPALGMARDWDLMSFPVLLSLIWLLSRKRSGPIQTSSRLALAALLATTMVALSFMSTNLSAEASESRFHSIIEECGDFEDTGWAILTTYYLNTEQDEKVLELVGEMEKRGIRPTESAHVTAKLLRKQGRLDEAEVYYLRAIYAGKFTPRLKNELGQLYLGQGRYRDAIDVFKETHREAPRLTFVVEGLALAYIRMGMYDTAALYADTLFLADPHSPGGHLVQMVIALNRGNQESAMWHFNEFLKFGRHRSDYETMREHYGYLRSR